MFVERSTFLDREREKQPSSTFIPAHYCFLDETEQQSIPVHVQLVKRQRTQQIGPWSNLFDGVNVKDTISRFAATIGIAMPDEGADDGPYLRIDRILTVTESLRVHSIFVVPITFRTGLMELSTAELIHEDLAILACQSFETILRYVDKQLLSEFLAPEHARMIGALPGQDGFRIDFIGRTADRQPLYWERLVMPVPELALKFDTFSMHSKP